MRAFALAVVAISAALFVAAVPFAKVPLTPIAAFIPAYESALVANDLITAALLFGLLGRQRSRALVVLASGYLFTAVIAAVHALTFPGLVTPTGLLGAGPQTTAWLYMFWHGAFPVFVIAYAVMKDRPTDALRMPLARTIAVASVSTVALVAALSLLATAGKEALPPIMSGNRYTPQMIVVVSGVWIASMAALATLWIRRPHSVIDIWLMVVMCAWIFDIALSAVLNAGRFDLGFYAGRIYGLVAASLVLIVLVGENARMHLRLAQAAQAMEAEHHRLVASNAALEEARLAALSAERAKGAFLATMSHEIRTPMNGILGMLELLSLMKLDGEQRTTLEIVRASGKSLLRIIDDILDFSKIEAGKLELRPEAASVATLVERVRDIYSGNASSKGLDFDHRVDGRISPSLLVDPLRLQQILNNLVSNAIKFTDSGAVSLLAQQVRRDGDTEVVRFIVEDTGSGISEADRARLFEPFAQAGSRHAGGTGLGLSICRSLAELMGGTLQMTSTLGEGTSVTLTLPMKVASSDPAVATPAAGEPAAELPDRAPPTIAAARMKGTLVLVVDDHPVNRMLLVKQLHRLGYAAEAASHGVEALERLALGGIGAVITDCNMPEMDGYELTRRIRAVESRSGRRRVPIIACTANALGGEAANCFAAGMDDYLAKPVLLAQLDEKLARWLPHDESPPMPPPSGGPIERSALAEITGGDPEVEREMLAQFLRYGLEDAGSLRIAIASRDMETAVRSAHRMKGAAAAIGAQRLAAASARIEASGKAHDWAAMLAGMEEFELRMGELEAHLAVREI